MSILGFFGAGVGTAVHRHASDALRALGQEEPTPYTIECGQAVLGATHASSIWRDEVSGVSIAWSGKLFNSVELAAELSSRKDGTPAYLACQAFLRHGLLFPRYLYGEFSLLLWDPTRKRMLLARDGMSQVSLFYKRVRDGFVVASELQSVLAWPGVEARLSDEAVARFFSLSSEPGMTLYRGVSSVLGGHVLALEVGKECRAERFWDPVGQPQLHLRDWREYAVALREGLRNAVEVRLPSEGLVASQLSSGFDSSGVSALAAAVLARRNRSLLCYTSVPVKHARTYEVLPNRFANEWPLAAKVASMYPNVEHVAVPSNYGSLWEALDALADATLEPSVSIRNLRWYYGILREAQKRGAVTMLEGLAGNLTSSYSGAFGLYDLRQRRRWIRLLRGAYNQHREGTRWITVARAIWMPGEKATSMLQKLRGRPVPTLFDRSLMRKEFFDGTGLKNGIKSRVGRTVEGDRSNGATWRFSILSRGDAGGMRAFQMRSFGLQREDPTSDTRLVELLMTFPDEVFAPEGKQRELFREAFRQHLPHDLLHEPMRGLQAGDFLDHVTQDLPLFYGELERLEQTESVRRILDLPRMRAMLDSFHKQKAADKAEADQTFNYTVGGALAFGRFLRRMQENARPA